MFLACFVGFCWFFWFFVGFLVVLLVGFWMFFLCGSFGFLMFFFWFLWLVLLGREERWLRYFGKKRKEKPDVFFFYVFFSGCFWEEKEGHFLLVFVGSFDGFLFFLVVLLGF